MKLVLACMMATGLLLGSSGLSGATTIFHGYFGGYLPDGGSPVVTGNGTNFLTWGDPGSFGVGPSSVRFDGFELDEGSVLSGDPFSIGRLSYYNGTIRTGTGISATVLNVGSDDFDYPDLDGLATGYTVHTESTPNIGDPAHDADYLFLETREDDGYANYFHVYEGGGGTSDLIARLNQFNPYVPTLGSGYRLELLGFANPQGNGFLSDSPVPEPNPLLLTLSGLGLSVLGVAWKAWGK